ncbi:MFS transporter [Bordetella tumbae]|uniref:MFS transporter n=1 Tax=Bordetella tumbae TaxID=1649139 RepID=UPI0039EF70E4
MDKSRLAFVVSGFCLIATCYGLTRFAFGLFLPAIATDLALSESLSGLISGGSFLGYCLAIIASATLTERLGSRVVAGIAGGIATIGLVGIVLAPNGVMMAVAVLFAGLSTGLASPPLAAAVADTLESNLQDRANTIINAGASGGIALSAPAAFIFGSDWRAAFAVFAMIAAMTTYVVTRTTPKKTMTNDPSKKHPLSFDADVKRLCISAFLMGVGSTAVWSFGSELTRRSLGWASDDVGWLWFVIGIFGLAGGACGTLIRRFGLNLVHVFCLLGMSGAVLTITLLANSAMILASGGLFGAAYMTLTGVYLVWGVRAMPNRPATGITVGFLAISIGQMAGAPLFGYLIEHAGEKISGIAFAFAILPACAFFNHSKIFFRTSLQRSAPDPEPVIAAEKN